TNTGPIPGITKGVTDLTGKELYVRQRLLSGGAETPQLHTLTWYVDGNVSSYIAHDDTEIGEMRIESLPNYSFRDGMDNYAGSGWTVSAGVITQESGFIRLEKSELGDGTQIIIGRFDQALTAPYTIDFRIRTNTA